MGWRWQPDESKAYNDFNEGTTTRVVPEGWVWVEGVESQGRTTFNEGQSSYEAPPPDPTGKIAQKVEAASENSSGSTSYVDSGSGLPAQDQAAAEKQYQKQLQDEFDAVWKDPNASSWDKLQAVQKRYGIETVAQMAKQGHFSDVPELGRYIAARQAEGEAEGFSVGGNQLGLWPVLLGVAAFAWAAGGLATSTGGTTAGSTAGADLAAAEMTAGYGGMDAAAVAGADYSAVTADSLASSYLGNEVATTSGKEFLLADSGTTMTDVSGGMLESGTGTTAPAAGAETGAFDMGQFAPQDMGLDAASMTKTPGIIDGAMTWMKANPITTMVGGQLLGGVVSGIGQAAMQEDKQDHEREVLEKRLEDQQALEEWKRRFTQQGSYFDATPKIKPAADTRLKRPDGTPVHGPNGLISRTMGG